jgi:hypothetical protein
MSKYYSESNNKREDEYSSYDRYEGRAIKVFAIILGICIILAGFLVYLGVTGQTDFSGINCNINDDFWFEGNNLLTSDGWNFTLTKVSDYTLNGIVLALKTYNKNDYPYDPYNIFSPIDLLIGTNDVNDNPDKYRYSITSFENRQVYWYLWYEDISDYYYFKSHTGNNHIIPHNEEVLNQLKNISVNDHVLISGSLVNLYGVRGDETITRATDKHIGNFKCEVILVDEFIIEV